MVFDYHAAVSGALDYNASGEQPLHHCGATCADYYGDDGSGRGEDGAAVGGRGGDRFCLNNAYRETFLPCSYVSKVSYCLFNSSKEVLTSWLNLAGNFRSGLP